MTKTIKQLLDLDITDINRMNEKELRSVVGRLRDAGNKKLKRLQTIGYKTPALRAVEISGGKFSTEGKNINQLRSEYKRIRNFYTSKTSTATQYKKARAETIKQLKERGIDIKSNEYDDVFKIYEKLKEKDPAVIIKSMKYEVLKEISQMNEGLDFEDKILAMQERLDDIYEEQARINGDFDGVSEFFEI